MVLAGGLGNVGTGTDIRPTFVGEVGTTFQWVERTFTKGD